MQNLVDAFEEHRERLMALVKRRLDPVLLKRLSHDDVLQEVYLAAAKRPDYFTQRPDVPIYFKLRTILLQTLADIERRHMQAGVRDVYKETAIQDGSADLEQIEAAVTSPVSRIDRDERHTLLRAAVDALPENDRAIIALRHFDGMGNAECAAALGIEPKAASIRYVRALERLQKRLTEISCFKNQP